MEADECKEEDGDEKDGDEEDRDVGEDGVPEDGENEGDIWIEEDGNGGGSGAAAGLTMGQRETFSPDPKF